MRNKYNIFLKYIISTISIFVFIYLISKNISEFQKLNIQLSYFSIFIIVFIFRHFFLTYIEWKMISKLNIKIAFSEYLVENNLANLINLTSPLKIGAGKKLLYLKEKYNIQAKDYFSIFTTLNIHLALLFFSFFFIGLIFINILDVQFLFLFFVIFGLLIYILKKFESNKFFKFIIIKDYFSSKNLNIFWFFTFLLIVSITLGIFQTYFLILSIFQFENLIGSLFINSASFFANIIQLSPGNVGFLELVFLSIDEIINLSASQIIIYSAINRVASIFIFLVLSIKKNS
mgnify:FL=1